MQTLRNELSWAAPCLDGALRRVEEYLKTVEYIPMDAMRRGLVNRAEERQRLARPFGACGWKRELSGSVRKIVWTTWVGLLRQDAAHGGPADRQAAGNLGLGHASAIELLDLVGVECCCYRPAQTVAVLAGLRQAGTDSFPENLPLELREDGEQAHHGSTGGRGQIQCFGQ